MPARLRALFRGLAVALLVVGAPLAATWASLAAGPAGRAAAGDTVACRQPPADAPSRDDAATDVGLDDDADEDDDAPSELAAPGPMSSTVALGASTQRAATHGRARDRLRAERGVSRPLDPPPRA